ncbi:MAG TPA: DUF6230 family protein [Pseudonocardiaceae bacterium]|nr:DUF6230 family protein [Pseudonocardiaceae bacterium]
MRGAELAGGRRRAAPGTARGRTRWPRFAMILLPALFALVLLGAAAATGAVPIAAAETGRHPMKISFTSFSASGATTLPQAFQTRDGRRRTEVVVSLRAMKVRGLCASTRVPTPVGAYVLRISTPTITADTLSFAMDSLDGLGVLGQQLNLRHATGLLNGSPNSSDQSGFLPLQVGGMTLNVSFTIRWITAHRFHLDGFTMAGGRGQQECY